MHYSRTCAFNDSFNRRQTANIDQEVGFILVGTVKKPISVSPNRIIVIVFT